jgi:dGTPase
MRVREQLEQNEHLTLAPYGMKSGESRGREYPEPEAPLRTAFQRDRERVLHTTAFRRLQGKTQVFVVTEGDYYRTRITHTLEVAQIGRTIARALGANEDLVEGICLAHDLGHPPFGHAGERALDELMRDHGGFDHNRRSFEIITQLERRYVDFPGLNLTYEFREGIVKHHSEDGETSAPKEYDPHLQGTLEAQIASFVDGVAYNTHDLDDGLRAGLLDIGEVSRLEWWKIARDAANARDEGFDDVARHQVIRQLINGMVTDLIEQTARRIEQAQIKSVEDIRRSPRALASYSPATQARNQQLKQFLFDRLYFHPRVIRMTKKAERVLEDLFHVYMNEPRILPNGARVNLDKQPLERVVCHYIAGMTDRFALDEHARLFDPHERV